MKIKEVLYKSIEILKENNIEEPVLKARILLAYLLGVEKAYLVIHSEDEILEDVEKEFLEKIKEIANGKPLQHITNHVEFMKLDFYVDENVLIPRQDTEILVEEVINFCKENSNYKYKILDLCSGSGAIGISLAKYINNAQVMCTDISDKAIEIAKRNARNNGIKNIMFKKSDMFEKITENFDIIVSNPPYIKRKLITKLDKEVQKEPIIALDGGKDGLDFYKIIVNEAYKHLNKSGKIFLEIGYDQKQEVIELIKKSNKYKEVYSKQDLYANDRIVVASI